MAVPPVWPLLLGALPGHPAAQAGHRALPAQRVSKALGRHPREPSGAARSHRQRHPERWFQDFLRLRAGERRAAPCPQVLSIDEHFFTRRAGYATRLCDLRRHKVYDLVLGRSEAALEA